MVGMALWPPSVYFYLGARLETYRLISLFSINLVTSGLVYFLKVDFRFCTEVVLFSSCCEFGHNSNLPGGYVETHTK